MLTPEITKKIEDFVYSKPRSIDEIAKHIDKNWRTANRYIEEIEKQLGTIATRVFREGTRGALKIAYWASIEKISNSAVQEMLEKDILNAKRKEDFSPFNIYQHISEKNKKSSIESAEKDEETRLEDLSSIINKAEKQVLIFSGNLSFINLKNKGSDILNILEEKSKKGINIKILCRVDLAGKENIEKMLSINFRTNKNHIEIRHSEHPLRVIIVDNKICRIKEIQEPTGKIKELDKRLYLFYTITDKEWIEWLSKIFWKLFSRSIDAQKRLDEINKLPAIKF